LNDFAYQENEICIRLKLWTQEKEVKKSNVCIINGQQKLQQQRNMRKAFVLAMGF